jgi:ribonuclease BN (tRNA processing enzyme)
MPKLFVAAMALSLPLVASEAAAETRFWTLGTQGGPVTDARRSQPANLLTVDGVNTLVDVGDGTAGRLAFLDLPVARIDNVLISHLHFDHTAGLLAMLGLRFQTNSPKPLQVYGPPGTERMVKGLLDAMGPAMEAGYGVPGQKEFMAEQIVQTHEIKAGDTFQLGATKVTVAGNTHYSFEPGSPEAEKHQSLSFRFETPDRTIVYTGDTGPSPEVEKLARGADLLVGEMIDVGLTVDLVKKVDPELPPKRLEGMKIHLSTHHLTPADLGGLAAKAGVKELVVTHLAPGGAMKEGHLEAYQKEIAKEFSGKITIANDLDQF